MDAQLEQVIALDEDLMPHYEGVTAELYGAVREAIFAANDVA